MFEIKKTSTGYASAPTTLVNFNRADGASPEGSLIADAAGDLFGTTVADNGTVFEVSGSGFVTTGTPPPVTPATSDIVWQNASGQAAIWDVSGNTLVGGGTVDTSSFTGEGSGWTEVGGVSLAATAIPTSYGSGLTGRSQSWI